MAPFYVWGSAVSRTLPENSLFFTIQFPGAPGTQLIDLDLTQWF